MSEFSVIQEVLRRAAARRRLQHALEGLWWGLLGGTALWMAALALYKIAPIPSVAADWGWVASMLGATGGFAWGGRRRIPTATAARILEHRESLRERLSTALEINHEAKPTEWSRLVLADAASAIRGVDPARTMPVGLPRFARWIPIVLVVVVGLGFVPEYRSAAYLRKKREAELVRDTGRKMAELIRHELAHQPPERENVRKALDEAALLGDRLSQVKLTKADAVQDLANVAKRLEQEARQLDTQPALRRLQQAAHSPASGDSQEGEAVRKQLEKLQEQAGNAAADALEKLARQLQKAREMAAGMQGSTPDEASKQALSQALNQLAQTSKALGINPTDLENALDALKQLDFDRVLKDLNLAGADLDKLQDMAKKLSKMPQSMAQLGKDLAEQLERGQADAAAQTLDRMVKDLKESGRSQEEIQRIAGEIAKALPPAADYGKVADLLKSAGQGLASKESEDAARNLASAAAELRKMAQQAKDLQMAAATLEALQDARMALLNDKLWSPNTCRGGLCPGCALCKGLGWGKGGKPGRGVGTWADENDWLYYSMERTERWDNSGIKRPDMAPRGLTDRGDGRLSPNVLPTKLTGQFTPGQMPAITLKGVSIKGQSSVQYQEAVTAAQSDAQSALNQDRVPRAYRGAVKGYFDDLQ